ncbi:helix-turn-helix domain-containing protein [Candidatus Woesearchaeota archaeon]|nr:helix-turn-helix domain-containing protein [Candidatus Woesearchaeota archaeon]
MEKLLQEIGLSKNESIVYLKLSELGAASAYKIAKESKLFKANTYDVLNKLEAKGLVSKKTVEKKVVYEALDPSSLMNILDSKKEKISKIIPRIRLIQQFVKSESVVNIYKGTAALRNLFYHFLEFDEPFLTYGIPKKGFEVVRHWIDNFHKERIKKGIKMYHIYNFEAHERVKVINKLRFTYVRCLPQLYDSQVATNVCGDEVVLITFNPTIKIIQIKDKDMADAYKRYFNILWKKAEKIA